MKKGNSTAYNPFFLSNPYFHTYKFDLRSRYFDYLKRIFIDLDSLVQFQGIFDRSAR